MVKQSIIDFPELESEICDVLHAARITADKIEQATTDYARPTDVADANWLASRLLELAESLHSKFYSEWDRCRSSGNVVPMR